MRYINSHLILTVDIATMFGVYCYRLSLIVMNMIFVLHNNVVLR